MVGADLSEGFIAIAAGYYHGLGLKADGSIVAWGQNINDQTNVPSPNTGFIAVAAGGDNSSGLKANGSIVAWGCSGFFGNPVQCNIPSPNTGFVALAVGAYHSLGLKADGSIVAWGDNRNHQCDVPAPNSGFIAIAAGNYHGLGLKADGSIVAWGDNQYGQANVPLPNTGFIALAGGGGHSLGLKADGSVVAWGANSWGQRNVPSPNAGFISITAGYSHNLGLKADGSIVAWGRSSEGQLNVTSPNTDFIAIAAGAYHSIALKSDGSIVLWGGSDYGQTNIPGSNTGFTSVVAGKRHSLGLMADGSVRAWGQNVFGEINIPTPNVEFTAIDAGEYHSLGLKANGSVIGWGCGGSVGNYGQCNTPSPNAGFVAISAGSRHSLGLKADGSIAAWGCGPSSYYDSGQCSIPEPNANFVAISAGGYHSLGLKADGSIVGWGYGGDVQVINVPPPNTGFIAVDAGQTHSLGLKADGSIVAWGCAQYNYGQCNVPSPNTGFIAIAAGYYHSLGLKADGSIVVWGDDSSWQSNVPAPNTGFIAVAAGSLHSLAIRQEAGSTFSKIVPSAKYEVITQVLRISATGFDPNSGQYLSTGSGSFILPTLGRSGTLSRTGQVWSANLDLSSSPPPPGSHSVIVRIGGGSGRALFHVPGAGYAIFGTVRDGGDLPIAGATVHLATTTGYFEGSPDLQQFTTEADGTYQFNNVDPGWYMVTTDAMGYIGDRKQFQLTGTEDLVRDIVLFPDPGQSLAQFRGPMRSLYNEVVGAMDAETQRFSEITKQAAEELNGHQDAHAVMGSVLGVLNGAAGVIKRTGSLGPETLRWLVLHADIKDFDAAMVNIFESRALKAIAGVVAKVVIAETFKDIFPANEYAWRQWPPAELEQRDAFSLSMNALQQSQVGFEQSAGQVAVNVLFDPSKANDVIRKQAFRLKRLANPNAETSSIFSVPDFADPFLVVTMPNNAQMWSKHHGTFLNVNATKRVTVAIKRSAQAANVVAAGLSLTVAGAPAGAIIAGIAGPISVGSGIANFFLGAASVGIRFNGATLFAKCLTAWGDDMTAIPTAYSTMRSFLEDEAGNPRYLRTGETFAGHVTLNIHEDYIDNGTPALSIGLLDNQVNKTVDVRVTNNGTSAAQFRVIANGWKDYREFSYVDLITQFDATASSPLVKIPTSSAAAVAEIAPGQIHTFNLPYTGFWFDLHNTFTPHYLVIDTYSGPFWVQSYTVPYFVNRDLFNATAVGNDAPGQMTIQDDTGTRRVGGAAFSVMAPLITKLAEGTVDLAQPTLETIYTATGEWSVSFELHSDSGGSVVELRVYDDEDRCVGFDSAVGGVRQEFPAEFAGGDSRQQTVLVPTPNGQTYRVTATLTGANSPDPVAVSLWAMATPIRPAVMAVSPGAFTTKVYAKEGASIPLVVAESGGQVPVNQVGIVMGSLLGPDGHTVLAPTSPNQKSFSRIAAGISVEAPFEFKIDSEAPAGSYTGSATVTSANAGSQIVNIEVVLLPHGDIDSDGDADPMDAGFLLGELSGCFVGPTGGPIPLDCVPGDVDGDEDIDLYDFARFERAFSP